MLRRANLFCVVCNRCLYRNGVKVFDSSKYDFDTISVSHKMGRTHTVGS